MKRLIHITILSVLLLVGCSKPSVAPASGPEQYGRYIFFSQCVETKASLVESGSAMGNFGVVGFKYDFDKRWEAVNATATPNVFADTPQTVYVSADGTHTTSYTPLQGWANTKKYTFFAYYPVGNTAVRLADSANGSDYTGGAPAIKYTMNPASSETFAASMIDVMTATAHKDQYWKSAADNSVTNGEIGFAFTHCLSCLGLNLKNSTGGDITVNSVTFNLTGLQNQSIIIPLDGSAKTYAGPAFDIAYELAVGQGGIAVPSVTKDSDGVEATDKLILIPQATDLTFTLTVGYTRSLDGYDDNATSFTTSALTTALTEGKKHIVSLNFTDSTVDVDGEVSEEGWIEIPDVNSSFK